MRAILPHLDLRCEVTVGHLLLDYDTPAGARAKVNSPIRSRDDVEFLWQAVLERKVDWIVSDHACCATETKLDREHPDDVWLAKAGFGGTEYLLSGVFSEGSRRGMSLAHMSNSCPGTRRGDSAWAARATSPPASMPTWSCSTRSGPSPFGPRPRPRPKGTGPSRARSCGAR